MRLYAVVIGRADNPNRYVMYHPLCGDGIIHARTPLAIFDTPKTAREVRQKTLAICRHKEVFVVPLERVKK